MFSLCVNGPLTFSSILNILYGNKFSYTFKLVLGFSILAVLMVALPISAEYLTHPDSTGYIVSLIILLILGTVGGVL